MKGLKKLIYTSVIPFLGLINKKRNKYINVIYYHDIIPEKGLSFMRTNKELFFRQMKHIVQKGYKTVRFDDFANDKTLINYNHKKLLITFDDGWKSNYTEIFQFMKSNDIRYNIFLEVGKIGFDPNYLTWEQIKEMHESGIVGFGAHTYSHPNMSNVSDYDIKKEIYEADSVIEEKLGFKPLDFCFPFGAYSTESLSQIASTNQYKRIYTSDMAYSYAKGDVMVMGRNGISNEESFSVFKKKTAGYYNIFNTLKNISIR